jgi:hypothetical protein
MERISGLIVGIFPIQLGEIVAAERNKEGRQCE